MTAALKLDRDNPDHSPRNRARTPARVVQSLCRRFIGASFDLDAAAEAESKKAPMYLGPGSLIGEDALELPWGPVDVGWLTPDPSRHGEPSRVFLNPPFRRLGRWISKACAEVEGDRAELVIMIVPVSVSSAWWHAARRNQLVTFHELMGRIQFEPPPGIKYSTARGDTAILEVRRPISAAALMGGA